MVKYPSSNDGYAASSASSTCGTEVTSGNNEASVTVPTGKHRQWRFVSYRDDPPVYDSKIMKYLIYGSELCPTTNRHHWQGHVWFTNPRAFNGVRKLLNCDVRVSNYPEYSAKYCTKDEKYSEFGTRPAQGERSDIVGSIIKGQSNKEILERHGDQALRLYKAIDWARGQLNDCKRTWEMDVRIYWGPPGSGKTRAVYDEFGYDEVYPKMVGKWWDNYKGEACVLIDDFDPSNCFDTTFDMYLKLLDRYPMMVECKGGSYNFRSKHIIITSNYDPDTWFTDKPNRRAFFRRIKEIKHLGIYDSD